MNRYSKARPLINRSRSMILLRDHRVTLALLVYALFLTFALVKVQLTGGIHSSESSSTESLNVIEAIGSEGKQTSMNSLVTSKSRASLQGGLGYEYESGKKCPYKWHGGSPNGDLRGSCWCGLDSYCMCTPSLAIDAIIEVPGKIAVPDGNDNDPYIVVVRRKDPPKDKHAIPGGFVDVGETVEHATIREVKEETNLNVASLEQFHVYSDPARDARRHTVSVVFRCIVSDLSTLHKGDDAKGVDLIKLKDLLKAEANLAFDHAKIFREYAQRYYAET